MRLASWAGALISSKGEHAVLTALVCLFPLEPPSPIMPCSLIIQLQLLLCCTLRALSGCSHCCNMFIRLNLHQKPSNVTAPLFCQIGLPCIAHLSAASHDTYHTHAWCFAQTSSPLNPTMTWSDCRYAPKYVKEYVGATNLGESLHLAEFWVDMRCGTSYYHSLKALQCIVSQRHVNPGTLPSLGPIQLQLFATKSTHWSDA